MSPIFPTWKWWMTPMNYFCLLMDVLQGWMQESYCDRMMIPRIQNLKRSWLLLRQEVRMMLQSWLHTGNSLTRLWSLFWGLLSPRLMPKDQCLFQDDYSRSAGVDPLERNDKILLHSKTIGLDEVELLLCQIYRIGSRDPLPWLCPAGRWSSLLRLEERKSRWEVGEIKRWESWVKKKSTS